MGRPESPPGALEAGKYLQGLLTKRSSYRRLWQHRAGFQRDGLNQAAVARVLADHLEHAGERGPATALHRDLKDRVARALAGEVLSKQTLSWFVDAFGFSDEDAGHLEFLLEQGRSQRNLHGTLDSTVVRPTQAPSPSHVTVALYEFGYIYKRTRVRRRTIQVVRALEDRVRTVSVRNVNKVDAVIVHRGGIAGPVRRMDDYFVTEIGLTQQLQQGETASLEYEVAFGEDDSPEGSFRRTVFGRIENVTLVLQFGQHLRPRSLWWAIWQTLTGPPVYAEEVTLDGEHSVHRHFDSIERSIFGFYWRW